VDAVTTRSVLIYVQEKGRAFAAFHRVLRPGGRISVFEPINRLQYPQPAGTIFGYAVPEEAELVARILGVYRQAQPMDGPMLGFDEMDLVHLAERAGFEEVHLRLEVDVEPRLEPMKWETFAATAPNPLSPTFEEATRRALTPVEAERLIERLRPLVEAGIGTKRSAGAYLTAVKAGVE
jgi:hypothetical protein